ncbi:MAG: N-acetylmuramoyl-L-alanine amidase [Bacilli bacterium]|nr:N-acetylmuramoyl-L-alanine amidase [Bacilli bacterium]
MEREKKISNSKLATLKYPAHKDNYTDGRSKKIDAITLHHMAGKLTAKQCGSIFQNKIRKASSNYGIGYDGEIALYVNESDTSWCNSNWDSNCRSVTIEVSNSSNGGNWPVSDKSLNSLISLMADIAKRNGMGKLVKGKNVTWHSMYKNTNCPGPYLLSKLDYIIEEANKINNEVIVSSTSSKYKVGDLIILNGYLYRDSMGNGKGSRKDNYRGKITIINLSGTKPYHIDKLGWVSEDSISIEEGILYYKKYTGTSNSIVDALKSIGVNSSFGNRKKIAIKNGIPNYNGTPSQNIKMLKLLKVGKLIKI